MMHPYFRRPYPYYSYQRPYFPSVSSKKEQGNNDFSNNHYKNNNFSSNFEKNKNCECNNIENIINTEDSSDECFEIFGLKLHFDDLLIIALLFFLYQEDVKDTYLYIALILLLLS